jgi:methyl-accepting chemotaxis protein
MKLSEIRLAPRLGLGFGVVLLLVLAMAAVGGLQLRRIQVSNAEQFVIESQAMLVSDWKRETEINLVRSMVLAKGGNSSSLRDLLAEPMKATSARITGLKEQLDKSVTEPASRALFDAVGAQRKNYSGVRDELFKRLKMGDVAGVEEDADKLLAPAAKTYIASIESLSHHLDATVKASGEEQDRAIRSATIWLAALAAAALCAGGLLAWVITRSVVVPLRAAIETTTRVAAGDLSHEIDVRRGDEMGDLARSLAGMTAQLRHSMGDVLESSQAIRNASGEIAAGNADLSSRTEQAASSLQQTASAMEQLTGTVRQSADAARQATQLASSAAEVAQRGGAMVTQVVRTMDDIQQSSRKIADIIGTIDGIAFQTNILALNAAVEAARAGEQGRGFAVVASEVRNLAQRAAGAAQQIKSLIGASVERVEAGSRMVADTGTTMQDIVASVQRVSDMIGEISAAAAEQSNGIGQVNGSVSDLDRMTQQNASLVEESAAAAESMRQQAERLNALVVGFKL